MSTIRRPSPNESDAYYFTYINKVPDDNFIKVIKNNVRSTTFFLENLPLHKWDYRYAADKWSIKEVMIHIIDTERIMAYRALRIARKDKTPLPGFDQDNFINQINCEHRTISSILSEYRTVREASLSLFKSFDDEAYAEIGTASGLAISPRALGFIIAGHEIHHINVLKERYLI